MLRPSYRSEELMSASVSGWVWEKTGSEGTRNMSKGRTAVTTGRGPGDNWAGGCRGV